MNVAKLLPTRSNWTNVKKLLVLVPSLLHPVKHPATFFSFLHYSFVFKLPLNALYSPRQFGYHCSVCGLQTLSSRLFCLSCSCFTLMRGKKKEQIFVKCAATKGENQAEWVRRCWDREEAEMNAGRGIQSFLISDVCQI